MTRTQHNTQHTPGPWHFDGHGINANGCRLSTMSREPEISTGGETWRKIERAEQDANARLIAAAPAILAELQRIAAKIDAASGSPVFTAKEHDSLLQIIATATGREG